MATEDHDFDEINYFNLFGNKMDWIRESGGAVGELDTCGLNKLLESLKSKFGTSENAKKLIDLFSKSYLNHDLNKISKINQLVFWHSHLCQI